MVVVPKLPQGSILTKDVNNEFFEFFRCEQNGLNSRCERFAFKIRLNLRIQGGGAGGHSPTQGRSLIQCRCVFCMIEKETN